MSTEMVLLDAENTLRAVQQNEAIALVGLIVLIGGLVAWMSYVTDRWSWIPRNRHQRIYRERF